MRAKTAEDRALLELIDPVAESLGLAVVRVRLMGGTLRRREVAERRRRASGEEVGVRERDDDEDEHGDGRREETPHRKTGSLRQPHFWSL